MKRSAFLLSVVATFATLASADDAPVKQRVRILGASISIGFTPVVQNMLAVARTVLGLVRRSGSVPPRMETAAAFALSERERDVLRALVDGLAYKQIAARLGVSIDTVRTHIRALYKKLHVHSVGEAVSRGLRDRLTE